MCRLISIRCGLHKPGLLGAPLVLTHMQRAAHQCMLLGACLKAADALIGSAVCDVQTTCRCNSQCNVDKLFVYAAGTQASCACCIMHCCIMHIGNCVSLSQVIATMGCPPVA